MGTTWLFNVLKEIATVTGTPTAVVADSAPPPAPSWSGSVLIKAHRADPVELVCRFESEISLMACVMVRDAVPTFRSLLRTQTVGRNDLLDWLEQDLSSYEGTLPDLTRVAVMHEQWIAGDAPRLIDRLSRFLLTPVTEDDAHEIADRFRRENVRDLIRKLDAESDWTGDFRNYDTDTQWHAGHIGPENEEDPELSVVERARLSAIQARVEDLVDRYSLWNTADLAMIDAQVTAIDYLRARQESGMPSESFSDWLARGFKYLRPGR